MDAHAETQEPSANARTKWLTQSKILALIEEKHKTQVVELNIKAEGSFANGNRRYRAKFASEIGAEPIYECWASKVTSGEKSYFYFCPYNLLREPIKVTIVD